MSTTDDDQQAGAASGRGSGTPSPRELRAELERMIVLDLLGPVGGETETLDDDNVRDRYLLGALSPLGTVAHDPERLAERGVDGDDTAPESGRPHDRRSGRRRWASRASSRATSTG